MPILEKIKQNIADAVNAALKKKDLVKAADLVYPPNPMFGDISLPCFDLVRKLKKTATEIGEFLVGKIELNDIVVATKAIGPFLNFTFNKTKLAQGVIEEILKSKSKYGVNSIGKNKKVMIEFSNGNTHKEYHIGHLRNICYGDAITKILIANGYKLIPVSYINDFGIHAAKTLWAYQTFYKKYNPPARHVTGKNKGYFLGKIYMRACEELGKNKEAKAAVGLIMKNIESRQGVDYKLWQKTRKWSIDGFAKIHKELGIKFDKIFYESEFIDHGMELVGQLFKKHFLIKSEGAIIADLQKYDLGVMIILRSDGTALYPVADLSLAIEKFKKYKINKSIYIVDARQSLYFKQLFKILELLDFKQEMKHLSHEFVKLPEGMMSSRTGNVITYEDLRKQVLEKSKLEIKKRHKNWNKKKINLVAEKIANGSLKFEMIKVSEDKVIIFDINQALRFDGYTAAYLQYTSARINSISAKAQKQDNKKAIDFSNLDKSKEGELVKKLAKYPEIVKTAGEKYDPSEIAKYLFELAQKFNDYYHSVQVLKAKKEIRQARLVLIMAVKQVLENGLGLLGIEVVEEM
ncbi:arginine--tRNA ligase [Patescibacteria group bacterium]|nr:arginine--tRNA ligase [Patescibacteria group bacterium]MBU1662976.1 arginine--tRNA ligase [Patescibacteria group bacterium]MBU1933941.1 arginine--tRNA ligase [Patescibacteria group bacterium]MBU2264477.1 arginine--tRNA ligase [Patescibacteria group bacterium]